MLLVLPGSRRSEIRHHVAVFGEALGCCAQQGVAFEPVLPTVPHLDDDGARAVANWPVTPRIVVGETTSARRFASRARRWRSPAR